MIRSRRALIILAVLVGALAGLGLFTFRYAEGFSYFSSDPKVCVNCHIMNDQYDSWGRSTHHHVAVCNDCHLPHALVPKLIAKTRNGWNHSKAFTMQDFHEPIMIGETNAAILQDNCTRCHQTLVGDVLKTHAGSDVRCVNCHRNVGHGPTR